MSNLLKSRIFEISYKNKISHLSSNISSVDIIDEIFSIKKNEDIFILSNGHAGLALYVVLEKYYGINAEELYQKHGVHPHRDVENKIILKWNEKYAENKDIKYPKPMIEDLAAEFKKTLKYYK